MLNWNLAREVGYPKFFYRYSIRQFYKSILKKDNCIELNEKISINLPPSSKFGTELFVKNGSVDWGSEEYLIKYLDKSKSFLDIGANIGYYSLLVSPYCHRVYAFEPDLRSIAALKNNAEKVDNITVIQEAVYSKVGEMQFDITNSPELSRLNTKSKISNNCINVKVETLDNFADKHPNLKITAIKTDVEGADTEVLLGGKRLIEREQPLILSEAFPDSRVLKFVRELDYLIFGFIKFKDKSKMHLKPKFIQITAYPQGYRPKMIFLVPKRLHQEFLQLSSPFP
ncbi:MAG: FkbM family methyltransferase [Cyanobacteriota bacterium]|nr:FkbM family methyltransferase [Cyanobacteriota bacterium]